MKSKDMMMESVADLMWKAEEEITPDQLVQQLLTECGFSGCSGCYECLPLTTSQDFCRRG